MKKEKQIIIYNDAQNDDAYDFYDLEYIVKEYDNMTIYDQILCCADLGLWNGRKQATKLFNCLYDAIQACAYDENIIYFDNRHTTLKMKAIHHDGVNNYKFYKVINNKKYAIKEKDLLIIDY